MRYQKLSTNLFKDGYFRKLSPSEQITFLSLVLNPYGNMHPLLRCSVEELSEITGTKKEKIQGHLIKFKSDEEIYISGHWMLISRFFDFVCLASSFANTKRSLLSLKNPYLPKEFVEVAQELLDDKIKRHRIRKNEGEKTKKDGQEYVLMSSYKDNKKKEEEGKVENTSSSTSSTFQNPYPEECKIILEAYKKTGFGDIDQDDPRLIRAAIRLRSSNIAVKSYSVVAGHLMDCFYEKYITNDAKGTGGVYPGNLCSDLVWKTLLPQYIMETGGFQLHVDWKLVKQRETE